jgi:cobalamin biosynthesis protein CobD/CbiB
MDNERPPTRDEEANDPTSRPPLQFGLSTLLGVMVAVGLIFGVLRWLDLPPWVGYLILAVLVASSLAGLGLAVMIARWTSDDDPPSR